MFGREQRCHVQAKARQQFAAVDGILLGERFGRAVGPKDLDAAAARIDDPDFAGTVPQPRLHPLIHFRKGVAR